MEGEGEPTRIMVAVNQSTIKGYPHASISCTRAFEWTLQKIVRSNTSAFKLLFLHVQVPDEDVDTDTLFSAMKTVSHLQFIQDKSFDDVDSIYASPDDFKVLKHRDRLRGLQLLEFFVNRCHEIGVACESWVKKGDPPEVICLEVKRVRPDFLVLGSRGLGPFKRVFVGTVSEFCVKHAECPVITIKREEGETPEDPVDD